MKRRLALIMSCGLLWGIPHVAPAQTTSQDAAALQQRYHAALQEITRLQKALVDLQRQGAVTGESAPAEDFVYASRAYMAEQKYREAVAALTRALAANPQDATAYQLRGLAWAKLGDTARALQDLAQAIDLNPQDATAYNQRGVIAYARGELQQAEGDFSQAIKRAPRSAQAYNNRCLTLRKLGDYRRASSDCARAAELGMPSAQQHLQVLRDEVRQAQEHLRAAAMNPGPADGIPGRRTVTALQQYQRAHGLSATGLLDAATKQALGMAPTPLAASAATSAPPPQFVHQSKPVYPDLARQRGWEGTVTLRLEMRADGAIGQVAVVRSSGHAVLDAAAQDAARTWTHTPARQNNATVTQWAEVSLTFALDKAQEVEGTR